MDEEERGPGLHNDGFEFGDDEDRLDYVRDKLGDMLPAVRITMSVMESFRGDVRAATNQLWELRRALGTAQPDIEAAEAILEDFEADDWKDPHFNDPPPPNPSQPSQ